MRHVSYSCAAILLLSSFESFGDIYGYVDESGNAHTSTMQIDARYYLFKKEPAPVAAVLPLQVPAGEPRHLSVQPLAGNGYVDLIGRVAQEFGLDAALIHAVVAAESGYNARALSRRGAMGLMQLMPGTALRYGIADAWDPLQNLRGGALYLRDLLVLFRHDLNLALAAYNAGEGAVIRHGYRIPPYTETLRYVPKVLRLLQQHQQRETHKL